MSKLKWSAAPVLAAILFLFAIPVWSSIGFQPVSPDEIKMTGEPSAPGAPAVILYREVNRDDYGKNYHGGMTLVGEQSNPGRSEENYYRIKVLTEAGRNQANIEIRYIKNEENIGVIRARTIRPDGTVAEFDGKVYDRTIVKNKNYSYQAKTFVLPDVQVGSIIEYFYTINFQGSYIRFSNWVLSQDLFTKRAKFTLKQFRDDYGQMSFRWTENLPPGVPEPKLGNDDFVRLEATNIPAFQSEDFMPPEDELKARVDFIYSYDTFESDPAKFWKKAGKKRNDSLESFVGKHGAIDQAVSQIVTPNDSPEVKLQKLYARVQQLRNTSYEPRKTQQELKNQQEPVNVDEAWKQGYGDDWHINWVFLALAKAAGFEAYGVVVSDRRNFFFNPQTMQSGKLDRNMVLVKSGGKDLYLDPGSAFTPFGLLPWENTGVPGLRLDKDGGTWIQTAVPTSSTSHIERKGKLKLSESGDLEGKLTITYTGLEALRRRLEERNEDDVARKSFLEDEIKGYIPAGSELELSNKPEWTNSEPPLVAEFNIKVSGWATPAGSRTLLPLGLFTAGEKHLFDHSGRVHPIYFEYPAQKLDDLIIELPTGWSTASIPSPVNQDVKVVAYAFSAEGLNGTIHLTRKVDINIVLLDAKYYAPLQGFFQTVKKGDDQQAVLVKSGNAGN